MVVDQSFSKDQPRFEIRSDEGENEGNVNFTHHLYGISPRKMVDLTNLTGSFTCILVAGLEPWNFMTFHSVGNVIIPTDEVIFFRGVGIPPIIIGSNHQNYGGHS